MDQCFRISVWMFFLVGYLRAAPVTSSASINCHMNMDDLSFDDLEDVNCKTVTFTYPTNVKTECFAAALMHFEKGFADAIEKCDSSQFEQFAIRQTKETLNQGLKQKQCMPQATCNFNQTVHGEFADFVTAAKTFVEDFNTYQQLKTE
ncbi:uncharacterized protein AB9X84_024631 [Acanthopagrus schlegelii]